MKISIVYQLSQAKYVPYTQPYIQVCSEEPSSIGTHISHIYHITVLVLNVIIITFTKIIRNYILYYCMEILTRHLGNSLHRLLNCEIGGLDGRVITSTTEYRTSDQCIQTLTRHS